MTAEHLMIRNLYDAELPDDPAPAGRCAATMVEAGLRVVSIVQARNGAWHVFGQGPQSAVAAFLAAEARP